MIDQTTTIKTWLLFFISILLGVVLFSIPFLFPKEIKPLILPEPPGSHFSLPSAIHISQDSINGKAYIIYDTDTNTVLAGENIDQILPLASITKLMTALVDKRDCNDLARSYINEMLITSSNSLADKIAETCPNTEDFINRMNATARDLGLSMTFLNPSGLDINDETEPSNLGSALSVAKFIGYLYRTYPDVVEHTVYSDFHGLRNTNYYASNWPFLLASKTGFTDMAGGNLAILFEPVIGHKIAIVVLGSTGELRFKDVYTLLQAYLKSL